MHPLDPLNREELDRAVEIIRQQMNLSSDALFEQVRLKEPQKALVHAFNSGSAPEIPREAFAVVLDRPADTVSEVVVSLDSDTMTSCDVIPGVRISFLGEESAEFRRMICEHPDFLAALERRGISDPEQVLIEGFAVANLAEPEEKHLRHTRAHCFFREDPQDNAYARPIEGLVPVVDLNNQKVLRIEDNGVVPLPRDLGDYRSDRLQTRKPLAPLDITQPDGPDFKVDGCAVEWQNWRFRVGFTPREGLVLHTLSLIHI